MNLRFRFAYLCAVITVLAACGDGSTDPQEPQQQPPPAAVATVEITGAKPIQQGGKVQLNVVLHAESGAILSERSVRWESSDTGLASVSSSGMVTAVGRTGTVTIKATSEGKSGSTTVPVWWLYRSAEYALGASDAHNLTISDPLRVRQIPVRVWIPTGAPRPLPVVILARTTTSGPPTGRWSILLASSGYAVIETPAVLADQNTCAEYHVPTSECSGLLAGQTGPNGSPIVVLASARDVSTVLDSLAFISRSLSAELDLQRVAVSGTSRGAAVVMALAGATVDVSPTVKDISVRDQRFAAYVANSPPGTTSTGPTCGCSSTSWQAVSGPTFSQTSSGDGWGRREPFDRMPAGDKYLAFYNSDEVDHLEFSLEFAVLSVPVSPYGQFIGPVAVAFLDAYLRGSVEARDWLKSGELARGTNAVVQLSDK